MVASSLLTSSDFGETKEGIVLGRLWSPGCCFWRERLLFVLIDDELSLVTVLGEGALASCLADEKSLRCRGFDSEGDLLEALFGGGGKISFTPSLSKSTTLLLLSVTSEGALPGPKGGFDPKGGVEGCRGLLGLVFVYKDTLAFFFRGLLYDSS